MAIDRRDLKRAVTLAQAGNWDDAHKLVQQDEDSELSCWLHAVLHKIEGDEQNSRYWYRRTEHNFEDVGDPQVELENIAATLE